MCVTGHAGWRFARALLTSSPEGKTAYIDADLRDSAAILGAEETRQTFDLGQPIALSRIAILRFITDDNEAHRIIDELMAALPPGSVLALSTVTADSAPGEVTGGVAAYNAHGIPTVARDKAEVEFFFRGLDLVEPDVTLVNHWWPDERTPDVADAHVHMYGGIAVKRCLRGPPWEHCWMAGSTDDRRHVNRWQPRPALVA